jgi:hypothetical protein
VPAVSEYLVRLHFAEIWFGAPGGGSGGRGSRVFSVDLEGAPAEVVDLDLLAAAQPMTAVVKELRVRVVDGRLNVATSAKVDQAKLSAIEVLRVPETVPVTVPVTPPVPSSTSTFAPGQGRPFADGTAYNAPLPANAVLDPASSSMVAFMARNGRAYANLYAYADPVFDGDSSSPLQTVRCTMPWGTCDTQTRPLRIPAVARPTPGTDGRMIIVDWTSRQVCDFWQARRTSTGGWEASWATCASIDGGQSGPSGGATGAGINALAGVVRTYEMRQGRIDHALSFATDNSCRTVFRFPAVKTDGSSSRGDCIPEGARVQLDPVHQRRRHPRHHPRREGRRQGPADLRRLQPRQRGRPHGLRLREPDRRGRPLPRRRLRLGLLRHAAHPLEQAPRPAPVGRSLTARRTGTAAAVRARGPRLSVPSAALGRSA